MTGKFFKYMNVIPASSGLDPEVGRDQERASDAGT